jgi:hypothetical protein
VSFYKTPFGARNRYQFAVVPAGGRATVYLFTNWGQDFRAFIERVGVGPAQLPWNLVSIIWLIDGECVEEFNWQLHTVNQPKQFYSHQFIARRRIEWIGINNDVVPHVFEVLCDGMLVMLPTSARRYNVV